MNGEMNEQTLNRYYEEFSKEALRLMTELRQSKDDEKDIQKQLSVVQTIISAIFRLRSLKKKGKE
jgi:hypothetical protein